MSAPAGAGAGAPAAAASSSSASSSSIPAYRFDAARWSLADRIAGIATIVLFIALFLPWFTATASIKVGGVSVGSSGSVNGLWHTWMYLTLILSIAIVAYLGLKAGWDQLPISQEVPHLTVMIAATVINLVLVLIAFIDKPSGGSVISGIGLSVGWGFGAVLGLIAAIIAAAPYVIPQLRARTM